MFRPSLIITGFKIPDNFLPLSLLLIVFLSIVCNNNLSNMSQSGGSAYYKEIEMLTQMGKELGFQDEELRKFVLVEKEQLKAERDTDRDMRLQEREHEKERATKEREHEKERITKEREH